MVGPALALQFILLVCYFGLTLSLLIATIRKRHTPRKAIYSGILFLGFASFAIFVYLQMQGSERQAAKKFLGYYKLNKLDKQKCVDCRVRLKNNYEYDIIIKGRVVGQGKWHLETAIDIPGPFLKVDNGPTYVVWESDRLIDYIDRTSDD